MNGCRVYTVIRFLKKAATSVLLTLPQTRQVINHSGMNAWWSVHSRGHRGRGDEVHFDSLPVGYLSVDVAIDEGEDT